MLLSNLGKITPILPMLLTNLGKVLCFLAVAPYGEIGEPL